MRLLAAPLLAALTGCASGLAITYQSDPPGATLYQDGKPMGITPYRLTYQPEEAFKNGGCMVIRETGVKWASGATASTNGSINACHSNGFQQVYTFVRPDVPGRDVDVNVALQMQRNGIAAAQNMLLIQALTPRPAPAPALSMPTLTAPQQTHCRTYRLGDSLHTTCN